METSVSLLPLTVEQYLRNEADGGVRNEYIGGRIHAMAGGSESHNLIAGNVFASFHAHLRGGPCQAYMADFKVRLEINRENIFYYPDVTVACQRVGVEQYYLRYPTLLVEVLSPSTENIDRRERRGSMVQKGCVLTAREAKNRASCPRHLSSARHPLHRGDQLLAPKRLGEHGVRADTLRQAQAGLGGQAAPASRNGQNPRRGTQAVHGENRVESVDARHHQIDNHEVHRPIADELNQLPARGHARDVVAYFAQPLRHQASNLDHVVRHHDREAPWGGLRGLISR